MNKKLKKVSNYNNYDDWVADVLRQEKNGVDEYIKIAIEHLADNKWAIPIVAKTVYDKL